MPRALRCSGVASPDGVRDIEEMEGKLAGPSLVRERKADLRRRLPGIESGPRFRNDLVNAQSAAGAVGHPIAGRAVRGPGEPGSLEKLVSGRRRGYAERDPERRRQCDDERRRRGRPVPAPHPHAPASAFPHDPLDLAQRRPLAGPDRPGRNRNAARVRNRSPASDRRSTSSPVAGSRSTVNFPEPQTEDRRNPPGPSVGKDENPLPHPEPRGARHHQPVTVGLAAEHPERQERTAATALEIRLHRDGDEGVDAGAARVQLAADAHDFPVEDLVGDHGHPVQREMDDGGRLQRADRQRGGAEHAEPGGQPGPCERGSGSGRAPPPRRRPGALRPPGSRPAIPSSARVPA